MNNPKIAIIWSRMPGYALACLKELKLILKSNLFIGVFGDAPPYITSDDLSSLGNFSQYRRGNFDKKDYDLIMKDLNNFNPDVLIVTGWNFKVLRLVAQAFKAKGKVTVSMVDTPWKGDLLQSVKAFLGRKILKQSFSKIWVPGIDAKRLIKFVGYDESDIWMNLYCCDTKLYNSDYKFKNNNNFIFIGRLESVKNITCLKNGFLDFKKLDQKNFKLLVIGDGSQKELINQIEHIECLGWKNGNEIIKYLRNSSGFILPSIYEPWGVVVHEAAASGIPLILSDKVGARNEFLVNNYNGKVFNSDSSKSLSEAIKYVSMNNENNIMGERSSKIASKLNIKVWCESLILNSKDSVL